MRKYSFVLISYALFWTGNAFADTSEFSCYYKDNRYTFTISSDRQKKCPKWDTKKQTNPPLAAAKALAKAEKFIAKVKTDRDYAWEQEELSLVNVYGWLWRVRFRLTYHGLWNGPPSYMDCYLLMDGSIVEPIVTANARSKRE
jgi:hypothetical protein